MIHALLHYLLLPDAVCFISLLECCRHLPALPTILINGVHIDMLAIDVHVIMCCLWYVWYDVYYICVCFSS